MAGNSPTRNKSKNASDAFMERTFDEQHNGVKDYYAIIQVTEHVSNTDIVLTLCMVLMSTVYNL